MDKLSSEQQAKVKKMSDLRIRSTLIHAGQDETMVSTMNREQLLEAMAVHYYQSQLKLQLQALRAYQLAWVSNTKYVV